MPLSFHPSTRRSIRCAYYRAQLTLHLKCLSQSTFSFFSLSLICSPHLHQAKELTHRKSLFCISMDTLSSSLPLSSILAQIQLLCWNRDGWRGQRWRKLQCEGGRCRGREGGSGVMVHIVIGLAAWLIVLFFWFCVFQCSFLIFLNSSNSFCHPWKIYGDKHRANGTHKTDDKKDKHAHTQN